RVDVGAQELLGGRLVDGGPVGGQGHGGGGGGRGQDQLAARAGVVAAAIGAALAVVVLVEEVGPDLLDEEGLAGAAGVHGGERRRRSKREKNALHQNVYRT